MAEIISIMQERQKRYVLEIITTFLADPPANEFQAGYLSGLLDLFDDTIETSRANASVKAARMLIVSRAIEAIRNGST